MSETFSDNMAQGRYELQLEDGVAVADYDRHGSVLTISRVFTPEALRGQGAAGRLMRQVADAVRAEGGKIEPRCPYAAAWMKKHPDEADLLA